MSDREQIYEDVPYGDSLYRVRGRPGLTLAEQQQLVQELEAKQLEGLHPAKIAKEWGMTIPSGVTKGLIGTVGSPGDLGGVMKNAFAPGTPDLRFMGHQTTPATSPQVRKEVEKVTGPLPEFEGIPKYLEAGAAMIPTILGGPGGLARASGLLPTATKSLNAVKPIFDYAKTAAKEIVPRSIETYGREGVKSFVGGMAGEGAGDLVEAAGGSPELQAGAQMVTSMVAPGLKIPLTNQGPTKVQYDNRRDSDRTFGRIQTPGQALENPRLQRKEARLDPTIEDRQLKALTSAASRRAGKEAPEGITRTNQFNPSTGGGWVDERELKLARPSQSFAHAAKQKQATDILNRASDDGVVPFPPADSIRAAARSTNIPPGTKFEPHLQAGKRELADLATFHEKVMPRHQPWVDQTPRAHFGKLAPAPHWSGGQKAAVGVPAGLGLVGLASYAGHHLSPEALLLGSAGSLGLGGLTYLGVKGTKPLRRGIYNNITGPYRVSKSDANDPTKRYLRALFSGGVIDDEAQ